MPLAIVAHSGSYIIVRLLAAPVLLFFGFQMVVWFTLGVFFVLFDKNSKGNPVARIRTGIILGVGSLIGLGMFVMGIVLAFEVIVRAFQVLRSAGHN
jgi:hypothetical protein